MEKQRLSNNWKFFKGCVSSMAMMVMSGKNPDIVDLPHDAMIFENRTPDTKNGAQTGFYPGGIYTYFRELKVPSDWKDKRVIIEFEGIYETAMVYINGALAKTNLYGYSGFYIEMNPYLNYGEVNEIKVIADNSSEENSRWYSGSGIYRYVNLYIGNKECIDLEGTRLTTVEAKEDTAKLLLQTKCRLDEDNSYQLQFVLKDDKEEIAQKVIASEANGIFEGMIDVANVKLWDCETPYLYHVEISLLKNGRVTDTETFQYGIRTIEVHPGKGFLLNGKTVPFRGTCLHHDNGITGAATFHDADRFL